MDSIVTLVLYLYVVLLVQVRLLFSSNCYNCSTILSLLSWYCKQSISKAISENFLTKIETRLLSVSRGNAVMSSNTS